MEPVVRAEIEIRIQLTGLEAVDLLKMISSHLCSGKANVITSRCNQKLIILDQRDASGNIDRHRLGNNKVTNSCAELPDVTPNFW